MKSPRSYVSVNVPGGVVEGVEPGGVDAQEHAEVEEAVPTSIAREVVIDATLEVEPGGAMAVLAVGGMAEDPAVDGSNGFGQAEAPAHGDRQLLGRAELFEDVVAVEVSVGVRGRGGWWWEAMSHIRSGRLAGGQVEEPGGALGWRCRCGGLILREPDVFLVVVDVLGGWSDREQTVAEQSDLLVLDPAALAMETALRVPDAPDP